VIIAASPLIAAPLVFSWKFLAAFEHWIFLLACCLCRLEVWLRQKRNPGDVSELSVEVVDWEGELIKVDWEGDLVIECFVCVHRLH
jgi:hypothetical protein